MCSTRPLYGPLTASTSIRLLILHKGATENDIVCRLIESTINSPRRYEALSYVWGQSSGQKTIFCNGFSFSVTTNLYSALKRLRFAHRCRVLWIDQLCINQEDIPERSQQVQIMRDIYRSAERALVWLGEEEDRSALAIGFIKLLVQLIQSLPPGQTLRVDNLEHHGLPPANNPCWLALGHFLRRPWFQRVWTIQEGVVARDATVLCGENELSWSQLVTLLLGEFQYGIVEHPILRTCVSFNQFGGGPPVRTALRQVVGIVQEKYLLEQANKPGDIMQTLRVFRDCLSTDPKDKVFAFLGCVPIEVAKLYSIPDYSRSVRDIYTEVATVSLLNFKSLAVLSHGGYSLQCPEHNLPSWVPDWSVQARGFTFEYANYMCIHHQKVSGNRHPIPLYNATRNSAVHFTLDERHASLTVSGKIVGRLEAVGTHLGFEYEALPNESVQGRSIRQLLRVKTQMKTCFEMAEHSTIYAKTSGQNHISAVRQTLVAGMTPIFGRTAPSEVNTNFEAYDQSTAYLLRANSSQPLNETPAQEERRSLGTRAIGWAFEEVAIDRAFAVLEEGYTALVPVKARPGDLICVVLGCAVPSVIREERGGFALVGESYVHGIMDGEVMGDKHGAVRDITLI